MAKIGIGGINLDAIKHALAVNIVKTFSLQHIRQHCLKNIDKWIARNSDNRDYGEWRNILITESDEELILTMTSESERSVRLRQSSPWAGLMPKEQVQEIKDNHLLSVIKTMNKQKR